MAKEHLTEKERNIQQVPFRLHMNDHKLLKKLLGDDSLTFQGFVDICVQAYLKGDPTFLKMVKQWKELNTVPKEVQDRYTLSQRERQALLDEIGDADKP